MMEPILSDSNASPSNANTAEDHHTDPITLNVVFRYINKSDFPVLWKTVLEINAINPTTVCFEQSFSCLKHSNHINMKRDKLCSLVDFRLSIRGNDTWKLN